MSFLGSMTSDERHFVNRVLFQASALAFVQKYDARHWGARGPGGVPFPTVFATKTKALNAVRKCACAIWDRTRDYE